MDLHTILQDKSLKTKQKIEIISLLLLDNALNINELTEIAKKSKDADMANCIEAIEYATQKNPSILNDLTFNFITESLSHKAPRIKWESARVVGNVAHLFPYALENAINNLLINTEHEGTVVRWSAAFALGQIIKMKTAFNNDLISAARSIIEKEEKNSIRKIYLEALKKIK